MATLFLRDRRLLALTICLILVAGLTSFTVLPRMEDPELTPRAAMVNTIFPGADAQRVESLVTEKLEEVLREAPEIKEMRSNSRAGVSSISIELHDDIYETDVIWAQLRDKINEAQPLLPAGARESIFDELDVRAYALIIALSWTADREPNYAILRRLSEEVRDRLQAVPGTEKVRIHGDPQEEITITIPPERLAALQLSMADVAAQLNATDSKVAAGQLRSDRSDLLLEVRGELDSLQRIQATPIRFGDASQFVTLGDIATVSKGVRTPQTNLALIDGRHGVALGAFVRPDYRIDRWAADIQQALDDVAAEVPAGIQLDTIFQQNQYVQTRLISLLGNLILGGLAVVFVIGLLMGWRSALIVGLSLPLSALMVITGIRLLGIPIHQMSVTGLIIALGLLIDNAIVMVDEIAQRLRSGESATAAVGHGVRHLVIPLFGSTLTTALAFGPIALMPGPAGEFVGSIAVSVILAVVSSYLLAMTVIPALTALTHGQTKSTQPTRWWQQGVSSARLADVYRRSLQVTLHRPSWGMALGVVLPLLGFMGAATLPEQFFPPADRDQLQIELELPATVSIERTTEVAKTIGNLLVMDDRIQAVHWFVGESAPSFYYNVIRRREATSRYAQALVQLNSNEQIAPLIHRWQQQLDQQFPTARILVRQLEQGPPFDAPIEVRFFGPDLQRLRQLGEEARSVLADTRHVIHSSAELSEPLAKLAFQPDEQQLRLVGLDRTQVARQLDASLEGVVGGSLIESTEELPVRIRREQVDRADFRKLASFDLISDSAARDPSTQYSGIPLSSLGNFTVDAEIAGIPHLNSRRMNEVKAYLTAGVLPSVALADFQSQWKERYPDWPSNYEIQFGGEAAKRNESVGNLMANVGVLMVLMVATLVLSMQSFRVTAIVGSVALWSVGLGLGALALFGFPFGFMAIVGTMGLMGVAVNDSIVVLAALGEAVQEGKTRREDLAEVVMKATRHVIATSITTMVGFAPLVISGGGFWPPLAVAIAGGVAGATLLALYYVPAAFVLLKHVNVSSTYAGANGRASFISNLRFYPAAARIWRRRRRFGSS
ncbi:MAG: efflux RND transporter permease subunit [Pirellulaceae bacterium]